MDGGSASSLYTIGHSHHTVDSLVALLHQHEIALVVDVRSQPYSRWVPHFNKEALQQALIAAGLRYRFLGEVLGGRPRDPTMYDDPDSSEHARPDYARMAESELFHAGLQALMAEAQGARTAILCSEGDHQKCHRSLLITPALLRLGWDVQHIRPDGTLERASLPPEQLSLF